MKMIQLDEPILRQHYSHLADKPFFPDIVKAMTATPVIVMCLEGVDAVAVFREMTGATNGRKAAPGTIRGDLCVSGQMNIVHASDSVENAKIELIPLSQLTLDLGPGEAIVQPDGQHAFVEL